MQAQPYNRMDSRSIQVAQPAAGAEFTQTVPAGVEWMLNLVCFQYVTSATVANRIPRVLITDAANNSVFSLACTSGNQAASLTQIYTGGPALPLTGVSGGRCAFPLPVDIILPPGYVIKTSTSNIDPADQYSAINLLVTEFVIFD